MCITGSATISPVLPQNETAATVWNAGGQNYDRISRQIADAIEHCVDRLAPQPGQRILDVATGTGWTARRVAERSASVTAVDICITAIDTARQLDSSGDIQFEVADAEALPFADHEFDGVISTFGVMFCGDPQAAVSELIRVCKPGGRLALATWDNHGGVFDMFQIISRHKPNQTPPPPSPFAWALDAQLTDWFGQAFDLGIERAVSFYREQEAEDAWDAFVSCYGPVKVLADKLGAEKSRALREEFVAYHREHQTNAGMLVPRPYVITTGNRR